MTACTRADGPTVWRKTPKRAPGVRSDRLTVSSARRTHGNSSATKRPRRPPASPAPDLCSATLRPPRFSSGGPPCRRAGLARFAGVCWVQSPGSSALTRCGSRRATRCGPDDPKCQRGTVHNVIAVLITLAFVITLGVEALLVVNRWRRPEPSDDDTTRGEEMSHGSRVGPSPRVGR
jgi:hypothetical protein